MPTGTKNLYSVGSSPTAPTEKTRRLAGQKPEQDDGRGLLRPLLHHGYTDALLVEGVVHGVRSLLYHSGEHVRIGGEGRVGGYVSGVVSPLMALWWCWSQLKTSQAGPRSLKSISRVRLRQR